jgi:hypothetical protein
MQRIILLVLVFSVYFVISVCAQEDETDPTLRRARQVDVRDTATAPTVDYGKHHQWVDSFIGDKSSKEIRVKFNTWRAGLLSHLTYAAWEKEWNEYPESRPAFAAYIRHKLKTNRHLRQIKELNSKFDDATLFRNYLTYLRSFSDKVASQVPELEKELGITPEQKEIAINSTLYSPCNVIYQHYIHEWNMKKFQKQQAEKKPHKLKHERILYQQSEIAKNIKTRFGLIKKRMLRTSRR